MRDEIVNSLAPSQEQPEISGPMATHPTQYAHSEALVGKLIAGETSQDEEYDRRV